MIHGVWDVAMYYVLGVLHELDAESRQHLHFWKTRTRGCKATCIKFGSLKSSYFFPFLSLAIGMYTGSSALFADFLSISSVG